MVKIAQTHKPNVFRFRFRIQMRSFQMQQTGKMRANGKLTGGGGNKKRGPVGTESADREQRKKKETRGKNCIQPSLFEFIFFFFRVFAFYNSNYHEKCKS